MRGRYCLSLIIAYGFMNINEEVQTLELLCKISDLTVLVINIAVCSLLGRQYYSILTVLFRIQDLLLLMLCLSKNRHLFRVCFEIKLCPFRAYFRILF